MSKNMNKPEGKWDCNTNDPELMCETCYKLYLEWLSLGSPLAQKQPVRYTNNS